jgi:hypothetical protein
MHQTQTYNHVIIWDFAFITWFLYSIIISSLRDLYSIIKPFNQPFIKS